MYIIYNLNRLQCYIVPTYIVHCIVQRATSTKRQRHAFKVPFPYNVHVPMSLRNIQKKKKTINNNLLQKVYNVHLHVQCYHNTICIFSKN